jgi:hypothetical protein
VFDLGLRIRVGFVECRFITSEFGILDAINNKIKAKQPENPRNGNPFHNKTIKEFLIYKKINNTMDGEF